MRILFYVHYNLNAKLMRENLHFQISNKFIILKLMVYTYYYYTLLITIIINQKILWQAFYLNNKVLLQLQMLYIWSIQKYTYNKIKMQWMMFYNNYEAIFNKCCWTIPVICYIAEILSIKLQYTHFNRQHSLPI